MPPDPKLRPHLFVNRSGEVQNFVSPQEARGKKPPARDEKSHGRKLLGEYKSALESNKTARVAAKAKGVVFRFDSKPEYNLKLQSLDNAASGIELLAVKNLNGVESATVFVPEGSLKHFENAFFEYANEKTIKGNPKKMALVVCQA